MFTHEIWESHLKWKETTQYEDRVTLFYTWKQINKNTVRSPLKLLLSPTAQPSGNVQAVEQSTSHIFCTLFKLRMSASFLC